MSSDLQSLRHGKVSWRKACSYQEAAEKGVAKMLSSERAYFHRGTKEAIMEEEGRLGLGQLTGYLEPCGHLLAGLWETTRQGRVGSDIIRFAIFKGHSAC